MFSFYRLIFCLFQLRISFERFYDPDIEDMTEKYEAVDKYEFAITDNSVHGKTYTTWTDLITHTTNGIMVFINYTDFVSFYYRIIFKTCVCLHKNNLDVGYGSHI